MTDIRWNPVLNESTNPATLDLPLRWRKPRRVTVGDLFHESVPDEFIDRVFAVMASSSPHLFSITTQYPDRKNRYLARVVAGGQEAAAAYEARMREHFQRYKKVFREGYSLPAPPTPELRFLYDSAAVQEQRPVSPDGTTLRHGFSGGEYHWRGWPLSNVRIDLLPNEPE